MAGGVGRRRSFRRGLWRIHLPLRPLSLRRNVHRHFYDCHGHNANPTTAAVSETMYSRNGAATNGAMFAYAILTPRRPDPCCSSRDAESPRNIDLDAEQQANYVGSGKDLAADRCAKTGAPSEMHLFQPHRVLGPRRRRDAPSRGRWAPE